MLQTSVFRGMVALGPGRDRTFIVSRWMPADLPCGIWCSTIARSLGALEPEAGGGKQQHSSVFRGTRDGLNSRNSGSAAEKHSTSRHGNASRSDGEGNSHRISVRRKTDISSVWARVGSTRADRTRRCSLLLNSDTAGLVLCSSPLLDRWICSMSANRFWTIGNLTCVIQLVEQPADVEAKLQRSCRS